MVQVLQLLQSHPSVGKHLKAPSVSYGTENLYMRGPLEADTRPNLCKVWLAHVGSCCDWQSPCNLQGASLVPGYACLPACLPAQAQCSCSCPSMPCPEGSGCTGDL